MRLTAAPPPLGGGRRDELAQAIRFLKDNLDEEELNVLLDSLYIRGEQAAGSDVGPDGQPLISVEALKQLADTQAAPSADVAPKDSARIHVL